MTTAHTPGPWSYEFGDIADIGHCDFSATREPEPQPNRHRKKLKLAIAYHKRLWHDNYMNYKLYSAPLRSRLQMRAPMLEAAAETIEELIRTECWKYQPAIITDLSGCAVMDNGL
jgi:hypothetical protein